MPLRRPAGLVVLLVASAFLSPALAAQAPDAGGFAVDVIADANEYRVFDDGDADPMRLIVTSERDGYLTLLLGSSDTAYTVLLPSVLVPELRLEGGRPIEFPSLPLERRGILLRPTLPDDSDEMQQTVVALVTRRPVPLPIADFGYVDEGGASTSIPIRVFQRWLARIPVRERGLGQTWIVVRRP